MRTIKRGISTIIVFLLMVSMLAVSAGAAGYADAEKITHKDAVAKLSELNIMTGTGDGANFNPEGTITRGEMCKLIVLILNGGKDPLLGVMTGVIPLADVQENQLYPYIAYCYNLGVISGRGDGTFAPDNAITGTEATKMLLVAMGYNAYYEKFSGPQWALAVAVRGNQKSLFEGLDMDLGSSLSRDNAAQLINNAIGAVRVKYDIIAIQDENGELKGIPKLVDVEDGSSLLSYKIKITA
jgi:hypothetical protein